MAIRFSVAICEGNQLYRAGLRSLVEEAAHRVFTASSDLEGLNLTSHKWSGELCILVGYQEDANIDVSGVARLHRAHPNAHIIILADCITAESRRGAEAAGAQAVLHRSVSQEMLVKSIELIILGGRVFSPATNPVRAAFDVRPAWAPGSASFEDGDISDIAALSDHPHERFRPSAEPDGPRPLLAELEPIDPPESGSVSRRLENLSARESEILSHLARGHSNKVIARICKIADATVKVHVKAILRKIQVANRTQAAVWEMNRLKGLPALSVQGVSVLGAAS
ncbi:MAG: response regulator transcription factor [Aurantimonas endophytica]|uniref:response regulator transcription factor n=1 Tax=Aurantimonas endophytica TaxID=1522175 RepID=UPI0030021374